MKIVLFSIASSLLIIGGSCTSAESQLERGQAIICGSSLAGQGRAYCYVVLKESVKENDQNGCVEAVLDEDNDNSAIKVCGTYTIKK